MRFRIAAHLPRSQHICEIDADLDSTVGQLSRALVETFEPEHLRDTPEEASTSAWTVAVPSRPALDPASTLANAGIGMGSVITVVRTPRMRFRPRAQRHALEVEIDGCGKIPLRGRTVAVTIAEDRNATQTASASASPEVVFELRGRTWHVASPVGCRLNGHPLERSWPLDAGDVLAFESRQARVRSSPTAPFPQPSPQGHLSIHRCAPRHISANIQPVRIASPPSRSERPRWPTWTIFGSLLGAALMYLVWPQWYMVAWMAISSLWTVFSVIESRQHHRSDTRQRAADWEMKLRDAETVLASRRHLEALQLHSRFPSPTALIGRARSTSGQLWDATLGEQSTFELRVGTGAARSTVELLLESEPEDPNLVARIARTNEAPLTEVPITVDLMQGPLGICGPMCLRQRLWNALALQLATRWSPLDCTVLSIGFGAPPTEWLPHATDPSGAGNEVPRSAPAMLDMLLGLALDDQRARNLVLAIDASLGAEILELLPAVRLLIDRGVRVVWLAEHRDELLGDVRTIIDCSDIALRREDVLTGECVEVEQPDFLEHHELHECCMRLSPLRDAQAPETQADLPHVIDLRELPPLNSSRLAGVIGRTLQRDLILDLCADGPHALVAGTTGSGKSEFLRTWICALARESLPSEVTFMLIDYKGGAAFRDCAELPHVVGMLTDLDPTLATRVLISLRAEIRWREERLAAANAKDLQELERLGTSPFPSLVIVVDEFATLARDIPEFIDGILDIAQRGRSLGIHLILATQRPSGVVTDAIRANTNIRVCLRVPDDDDARDVVGSVDPARISGRHPGRGYLRIGHLPPVLFQSAYVSGAAVDLGRRRLRVIRAITPATTFDTAVSATSTSGTTSIKVLVRETKDRSAAAREGPPRRPWMDSLPERIPLMELADHLAVSEGAQP